MPTYFYTAKSFDGKTSEGNAYAKDTSQLAQSLKSEGMILVKAVAGKKPHAKFSLSIPSFRVKPVEKIMMTRNLQVMFGAGLSMGKIFDILSNQTKNTKLKGIMQDINARLNKGESFSATLTRYPKVFDDFFQNMVKVGEESGTLEEVFNILSTHMDRAHELKSKVRSALIYPCIILMVMAGIGTVVSIFVLPKFSEFLTGMNIPLPIYTRILIGIGNFSQKYWYLSLIVPVVAVYLGISVLKTRSGKWLADTVLIKIPFISSFIKKTNSAILIRSLSSLNASGISLVRSLEITSATVGNIYFKKALNDAVEKVKKGEKLSTALKPYSNIFPFGAIDMIEVGEETGKTSVVLKKISEFYEQEVIEEAKNFSVIIEPILLIFLGLVVAMFAISVIEPIYSSLKSI